MVSEVSAQNHYEILNISQAAAQEEIREAYRKLIRDYHPDKYATSPDRVRKYAEEMAKAINQAYEILKDSSQRRDYDQTLKEEEEEKNNREIEEKKAEFIARINEAEDLLQAIEIAKDLYDFSPNDDDCKNIYASVAHALAIQLVNDGKNKRAEEYLKLVLDIATEEEILDQARADLEILRERRESCEAEEIKRKKVAEKAEEDRLRREEKERIEAKAKAEKAAEDRLKREEKERTEAKAKAEKAKEDRLRREEKERTEAKAKAEKERYRKVEYERRKKEDAERKEAELKKRKEEELRRKKIIQKIAIGISTVTTLSILWFYYGDPQVRLLNALRQIENFRDQDMFEDCVNQANFAIQIPRTLFNFRKESERLLGVCQEGFEKQKVTLENSKNLANKGNFSAAIIEASKIKKSNTSKLYQESSELIIQWSNQILEFAEVAFQSGQLQEAINQARRIPVISETESLRQQTETKINQWKETWKLANDQYNKAKELLKESKWQKIIDINDNFPKIQFWRDKLDPIMSSARYRRNEELALEKTRSIENSILKGELMVLDTSRAWERIPWPQGWHGEQYVSRPAAWMYVKRSQDGVKWCWWVYVVDPTYATKGWVSYNPEYAQTYRQICDGGIDYYTRPDNVKTVGDLNAAGVQYKWVGNYDKNNKPLYSYSGQKTISCDYGKTENLGSRNLCDSQSYAVTDLTKNLPAP
jgi:curved DNA-binding protein CbpA